MEVPGPYEGRGEITILSPLAIATEVVVRDVSMFGWCHRDRGFVCGNMVRFDTCAIRRIHICYWHVGLHSGKQV